MRTAIPVIAVGVALTVALSGCATMQGLDVSKRTRVFYAPFDTVLVAAVDYCNEQGFAVLNVDSKLGILNTDYQENSATHKFFFGTYRAKINMQFKRLAPDATRVIANISGEKQGLFGTYSQATMTEGEASRSYLAVFTNIQQRLPPGTPPSSSDTTMASRMRNAATVKAEEVAPGKTPKLKLRRSPSLLDITIIEETESELVYSVPGATNPGRAFKHEVEFIVMPDGTIRRF